MDESACLKAVEERLGKVEVPKLYRKEVEGGAYIDALRSRSRRLLDQHSVASQAHISALSSSVSTGLSCLIFENQIAVWYHFRNPCFSGCCNDYSCSEKLVGCCVCTVAGKKIGSAGIKCTSKLFRIGSQ